MYNMVTSLKVFLGLECNMNINEMYRNILYFPFAEGSMQVYT